MRRMALRRYAHRRMVQRSAFDYERGDDTTGQTRFNIWWPHGMLSSTEAACQHARAYGIVGWLTLEPERLKKRSTTTARGQRITGR
jgi:hypothetical protein